MSAKIKPRKVAMWDFFNAHPDAAGPVRPGTLEELHPGHRASVELFVEALKGRHRVLDIGCGTGQPALYVAPHVQELVAVDAAPNMVALARENASRLGFRNATFLVGGAEGLPFGDREFDGVSLLGLLESMDWQGVHGMMKEIRRVLEPGGSVAILEQDWQHVLQAKPLLSREVRRDGQRLILRVTKRSASPLLERNTLYSVNSGSPSGEALTRELGRQTRIETSIGPDDLDPEDVVDAWYHEGAQFDRQSLTELVSSYGFREIDIVLLPTWQELFLTALA